MRSRNIKPGFFKNEILGTLDPIIALTYAGLWTLADKRGRLEDRPIRIKGELFPYRDNVDVNGYLTVLEREGFILRYTVEGIALIQVLKFGEHQSPHHTERESKLPAPPCKNNDFPRNPEFTVKSPLEHRESTQAKRSDSLIPDSLIPDTTLPSERLIRSEATASPQNVSRRWKSIAADSLVLRIYDIYPRKVGRAEALKATAKAIDRVSIQQKCPREDAFQFIYRQVLKFAESPAGNRNGFTPHCATWMNRDSFLDDPSEWWKDCETHHGNGKGTPARIPPGNALDYHKQLLQGGAQR